MAPSQHTSSVIFQVYPLTKSQKEVQRIIRALDYNFDYFSLEHFVRHIEQVRNRRIVVQGWLFEPTFYAVWVPAKYSDYILFNSALHPVHQTHSVLHELAHMLLGHRCYPLEQFLSEELLQSLRPDTECGCPRTESLKGMDTTQEAEAELFVFLIQRQVVNARRMNELYSGGSTVEVFQPYADGMGYED